MKTTTAREGLLRAALDRMLSKGYAATRVEEICAAAGVSKGSFYHFFPSKEELGVEALEAWYADLVVALSQGEFTSISDPAARLLGFLDHLERRSEEVWRRGCLLGGFASELAESNPEICSEVSRMFTKLTIRLGAHFEPFLARHGRADDPTSLELAEQLLATIEGSVVLAKAHADPGRIAQGVRIFRGRIVAMMARDDRSPA